MEAEVVVVGLGPGGEEVAEQLAEAGLDVVGIEAELVGGECPYWGCIPSKMMVRAAGLLAEGRRVPGMAGTSVVTPDWSPVARRIRAEATDTWDDTVAADRLREKGGRLVRGRARVAGPRAVEVDGETVTARRGLVLATGQRAWVPPMFEGVPHWTNRDAIAADRVPTSLLSSAVARSGSSWDRSWRVSVPPSRSSRKVIVWPWPKSPRRPSSSPRC